VRVVVVGANGFLGSHMVDTLVTSGHEVTAVDRFSSPPRFIHTPDTVIRTHTPGDSELVEHLPGVDAVMDFLGASTPLLSASHPTFDTDVTLPTATSIIDACVRAGVGHYYFASTGGAIYGDSGRDSNREDDPASPVSPYGEAKLAIENILHQARTAGNLASTIWRLSNPYGPRQDPRKKQGLIAVALHHHLTHTPIPVMGSGAMVRDYIYVTDAIGYAAEFLGRDTAHSVYNIGSGAGVSVNEILDTITQVVGVPLDTLEVDTPPGFVTHSVVSVERLVSEFGPHPQIDLAEGIDHTLSALRRL